MQAESVSILRSKPWKAGARSRMLTIPVEQLTDRCVDAWKRIDDPQYALQMLPTEELQQRFPFLRGTAEREAFYADLRKAIDEQNMEERAALFMWLSDPSTIQTVLWNRDGKRYFDFDCQYSY